MLVKDHRQQTKRDRNLQKSDYAGRADHIIDPNQANSVGLRSKVRLNRPTSFHFAMSLRRVRAAVPLAAPVGRRRVAAARIAGKRYGGIDDEAIQVVRVNW